MKAIFDFFASLLGKFRNPPFRSMGALLNAEDNRDIHLASFQQPINLPKKYMTDLSMLPVEDQGSLPTCVGQAVMKLLQYFWYIEQKVVIPLSARFLYVAAKRIDGIAAQGTSPRVVAQVAMVYGCPLTPSAEADNALSYSQYMSLPIDVPVLAEAAPRKTAGFAAVEENIFTIKQAIFQCGAIIGTTPVGNWNVLPVMLAPILGYHCTLWYGFEDTPEGDTKIFFRNHWGTGWLAWIAGWLFRGDGYFLWSQYKDRVYDVLAFTDVPGELIERAKKEQYRFNNDLYINLTHPDVAHLQKFLNADPDTQVAKYGAGSKGSETSHFGLLTQDAVIRFQRKTGLPATGFFGPKTRGFINADIPPKMPLVDALIMVESGGDDNAIGDKNLVDKAYGCLQIRRPYLNDACEFSGITTHGVADLLGERALSIQIYQAYMKRYATPERLGRPVTDEDRARIHNGGPNGWKNPSTASYWSKVKKVLSL